ncbi:hypothetical protein [Nostoc sp.]|uniref:hypothetical protein n=1 Tax=Nostoc sp. TaxID=1180 RepID=UPI002FF58E7C
MTRSQSTTGNAFIESLTQCLIRGFASNQTFPCSAWEGDKPEKIPVSPQSIATVYTQV